jgi:diaminohydroxyphosphoribosylaminopyrimidine deaminase/5-amino-6-(5-phosphoribosylamino)uracil reductase
MTAVDPVIPSFSPEDDKWMGLALEAGAKGTPSPNPHVGAVVVKNGELISQGHHERAGEEHAEVVALRDSGLRARGATLYVTLEPCNHVGRTAPCTDAVLASKVARVVIGCRDPNPHVE